jgi:hypothetical protein
MGNIWIITHSLRNEGANALALAGYSDTQIEKMGGWRGATFKKYAEANLPASRQANVSRHETKVPVRQCAGECAQ